MNYQMAEMKVQEISKGFAIPGTVEYLIKWEWNQDEQFEDALDRAVVNVALKTATKKQYPRLMRYSLISWIYGAWIELRSYISYVRGKYYVEFLPQALKRLGCDKIFFSRMTV